MSNLPALVEISLQLFETRFGRVLCSLLRCLTIRLLIISMDQVNKSFNQFKHDADRRKYKNSRKQKTPTKRAHAVMPQHSQEKPKKLKLEKDQSKLVHQSGPSQPTNTTEDVVTLSRKELNSVNRDLFEFGDMLKHVRGIIADMRKTVSVYRGVDEPTPFKHAHKNVEDNSPSTSTNVKYKVTDTPEDPRPEVPRPEVPRPEVPRPEVPRPEVPRPEVPRPEVPRPEVPRPEVPRPEVPRPQEVITRTPLMYGVLKQITASGSRSRRSPADVNNNQNAELSRDSGSGPSGTCVGSNTGNEKMVPIGSGQTYVPKSVYDRINWTSYTMATRKLLMAVFPRRTLATHSLTGKASPAFQNKPAKLSLDPKKVLDIVITVTQNSKVKENLVRNSITTKCADENKMMRIQNAKARKSLGSTPFRNRQNV